MQQPENTARFWTFCVCIALFLILVQPFRVMAGQEPQEEPAHAMSVFADGVEAFDDAKYDRAEKNFLQAIEMDPSNLQFQYYLGLTYAKTGRTEQALGILNDLIEEKPADYRKAYFDIAAIYSAQSQYEKALGVLDQAIQSKPDDARAHLEYGVTLKTMKRYDDAVKYLEKAATLDNTVAQTAYTVIGAIYFDQQKLDQAQSLFEKVVALDPASRLGEDAKKSLAAVAQQRKALRPWRVRGQFAVAYDDNVPGEAEDYERYNATMVAPLATVVHKDKGDWYETLDLYGDYRIINKKDARLGVRYNLSAVGYDEMVEDNVTASRPGLFLQLDRGPYHLDLRYDYTDYYTGGKERDIQDMGWFLTFSTSEHRLRTHQVMPTLAIEEPYGLKTDLIFSWISKDYADASPDSDAYQIGIVQSMALGQSGRSVRAGYTWYKEDPSSAEYEYFYHELLAGFSSPIYWGILGDVQYTYTDTHFKKSPVSGGVPLWTGDRKDQGHRVAVQLSKSVADTMQFVLLYSRYLSDSNVSDSEEPWYDPYNFSRNLYSLSFAYQF